jgi:hypothetical protein
MPLTAVDTFNTIPTTLDTQPSKPSAVNSANATLSIPPTVYYKMVGEDHNIPGLKDTWRVIGTPDLTGASYSGPLATPLQRIAIADTWTR